MIKLKYSQNEIKAKTKLIYNKVLSNSANISDGTFTLIGTNDLEYLFKLYNCYFFNQFFTDKLQDRISFRLSNRMTRAVGKTTYNPQTNRYEICLSTTLILQTFRDVNCDITVVGIICHNRLEVVMRIFEHEIIHLMEFMLFGTSSCSKPRFKQFSKNIFNHSDVTHRLVTHSERADKILNLRVGNMVSFQIDGRLYVGLLNRITKRGTVMVNHPEGSFTDINGNRFNKYYVPLQFLKPADKETEL